MNSAGCKNIKDVTPQLLKKYNKNDVDHATPASKQAFNIRIKNFLKYLGRQGKVSPELWRALPAAYARRAGPITTLSDDLLSKLLDFCNSNNKTADRSFYRNACMVKIMLFTGLRQSDVLSLRFDELNLNTMEIVKIQQKTGTAVHLPLTNAVLNSIFAYLEKERPDCLDSPYIFLTSKSPYVRLKNVSLSDFFVKACGISMGAHILRRTFASMLLKKTALSAEMISIMLGHRDLKNINKYLDKNELTLKICPIPLTSIEYAGDFYDDI